MIADEPPVMIEAFATDAVTAPMSAFRCTAITPLEAEPWSTV